MNIQKNRRKDLIKVQHPSFGYVEFRGMTLRQIDVLKKYDELHKKEQKTSDIIKKVKANLFK